MDNVGERGLPGGISLNDRDVAQAAAEFLASSTDRRKRGRPSTPTNLEHVRKKQVPTCPSKVNLEAARKSAVALTRESPSYKKLVEVEERLDLAIMRKQQDIKETLKSQSYYESRIFRLYLFNTYRSQPETNGVTSEDVASWSLRIQGRLLPKGEEPSKSAELAPVMNNEATVMTPVGALGIETAASIRALSTPHGAQIPNASMPGNMTADAQYNSSTPNMVTGGSAGTPNNGMDAQSVLTGPPPKCSDIFRRIVIELDKDLYPENNLIEWKRNDGDPSSDGFEISRAGSKEFSAKVFLYVDNKPEKFRLSSGLSRLIGVRNDTRDGVFSGVWQYVKRMRLQCVDDRAAVRLDDGIKSLLGPANQSVEVLKLQQLFAVVKSHMGPPEPLVIEYQVKLHGDVVDNQDCYDIQVSVQDTTLIESARKAGVFGLPLFPQSAEFEALNEKHLIALEKLAKHKKRRDFFEGFCSHPVQFINHLILSQTRDLKVLGGNTGRNPEEERRASFYQQQWVHEAVPRYLLRKAIADTAEDTIESGLK